MAPRTLTLICRLWPRIELRLFERSADFQWCRLYIEYLVIRAATLADNRVDRAAGTDAKQPSLLAGLVFDESGERLTPSHAVKKSTRYRYYVSRSLITGTAKDKSNGRRIPAADLERLVINKLRDFLADQGAMLDALGHERPNGAAQSWRIARGLKIAEGLLSLAPDRMRAMLMALLSRVDIRPECVKLMCADPV